MSGAREGEGMTGRDAMREAFEERWIEEGHDPDDLLREDGGEGAYFDSHAEYAWNGWRLAREPAPPAPGLESMLVDDNARMRSAGTALAEAALRVVREYDGLHRLAAAVSGWARAIADEGGRSALARAEEQQPAPVEWTREVPTEPGWYWVQVAENGPDADFEPLQLRFDEVAGVMRTVNCCLDVAEFLYGPAIAEPEGV